MLGAIVTNFMGKELKDDPVYQERLAQGLVKQPSESAEDKALAPGAKLSVLIFDLAIIGVVFYATAISQTVGLIKKPILACDHAIISFMLAAASLIALLCKVKTNNIVNAATFKSGMSACICVLGAAWLGTTFVSAHLKEINILAGDLLAAKPWMLAVVEFDHTGSTRIGKYVFDHPFLIPGVLTFIFAVVLGYIFAGIIL